MKKEELSENYPLRELSSLNIPKEDLDVIDCWINSKSDSLILKGMSNTGKRTILSSIIKKLNRKEINLILIAPNARLAKEYKKFNHEGFKSIYNILYSNKVGGEIKSSNGVILNQYKVKLRSEDLKNSVIVFVESNMISNSYYDFDSSIFGTGFVVNDLFNTFDSIPPKLLIIGDNYQLSRGNREECLLSGNAIKKKGINYKEIFLKKQFSSNMKELNDFRKSLAKKMEIKNFNYLPIPNKKSVKEINSSETIGKEVSSILKQSVYLCALNSKALEVNMYIKENILNQINPSSLCVGDFVDFHNSSFILHQSCSEEKKSITSGTIAEVTYVSPKINKKEIKLNGRKKPIIINIGEFVCKNSDIGEVSLMYLVDYLNSDTKEIEPDQILCLKMLAKEDALSCKELKDLKNEVCYLKKENSKEYEIKNKKYKDLLHNKISTSPILTAAKIRYAYAMTVHRAQGRKWNEVFLNSSRSANGKKIANDDYFRFLYTASICANKTLNLIHYPKLNPLTECEYKENSNCKIENFDIKKCFVYDILPSFKIKSHKFPIGFKSDSDKLKSFSYSISERLNNTSWSIYGIKQYSHQEQYILKNKKNNKIKVIFSYDKNVKITNITYPDKESPLLTEEIKSILERDCDFNLKNKILQKCCEAIICFFSNKGFTILKVEEKSEWGMLISMTSGSHSLEFMSWVNKKGLVTKIIPEKSSSMEALNILEELLNEKD